ncbi:hypothetical protein JZ751_029377 [Albula glossodonta]|uniref:Uncharacterized protein n=1 Tax=Albula glossodonta TaxID=121402 RepID=A0A8T2PA02_9TELE|nr:hypothetical protein JZ751_029377 [Albula glossodonta]
MVFSQQRVPRSYQTPLLPHQRPLLLLLYAGLCVFVLTPPVCATTQCERMGTGKCPFRKRKSLLMSPHCNEHLEVAREKQRKLLVFLQKARQHGPRDPRQTQIPPQLCDAHVGDSPYETISLKEDSERPASPGSPSS